MNFFELANSSIRHLTPYQPGKPIEELERELGITSSIKLASNENPFGASPKVTFAAQQALLKTHIYPDGAYYDIKHAISKHLGINANQLTMGNGSENVLELIIKSYLNQNDAAIISEYAFLTIPILLRSYGVDIKVAKAKSWGHDVKTMLNLINDKTRVLFLVNPNNPTGTYTNKADFEYLLSSTPPHVLIVVDEAYAEYISDPDYPDALHYLNKYPNLIITRTFSKVYGLAALRIGYGISSAEIADVLNRARLPFNVNAIAAKAACAAIEDQEFVNKCVKANHEGMKKLETALKKHDLEYIPSLCNFITINVGTGSAIYEKLLREGVIVRPLVAYNMLAHIRVTIGTAEEIDRFLIALEKCL